MLCAKIKHKDKLSLDKSVPCLLLPYLKGCQMDQQVELPVPGFSAVRIPPTKWEEAESRLLGAI